MTTKSAQPVESKTRSDFKRPKPRASPVQMQRAGGAGAFTATDSTSTPDSVDKVRTTDFDVTTKNAGAPKPWTIWTATSPAPVI
jgi:hypothetical protein